MKTESGAGTPPNKLKTHTNYKTSNTEVIAYASQIWPQILTNHGIAKHYLSGKHSPCPIHGGKDGFRFKNENKGSWVCATCTEGKFKDGFDLIALHNKISNTEAFKLVAQYLGLNGNLILQKNNETQLNINIEEHRKQQDQKHEQDQQLLTKKKTSSVHAKTILTNCILLPHPYLKNKGINLPVLVNNTNYQVTEKQTVYANALIVPIYDIQTPDQIISIQFINADGTRGYIAGSSTSDGIHIIKGNDTLPYICVTEGYSTGLSVFLATGASVIVACDANGMVSKAERLKASFSDKRLVFFGDNDKNNVGQKAANAAAEKTNGFVIIPLEHGDWDDYRQKHGIDTTKAEINRQLLEEQKAIKELGMSVKKEDVINLPDKLKSIFDLIPKSSFPYLSEKENPLNTYENIEHLLNHYNIQVRFNLVSKKVEITIPNKKYSKTNESEVKLTDIAALCVKNRVPKVDLPNWLLLIADKHRYSPAIEWINSKPWDGISRIDDFIKTVEADNPELAYKLIYRWMLGAVTAAFSENGVSLPGVLVFQGKQGIGKTKFLESLVHIDQHDLIRTGAILNPRDKDSITGCTNRWIVELGELDGTFNKSDIAALKAFLTNNMDYYRIPYARVETTAPRCTAFYASVNNPQFLVDETGNRRWWTISVKKINWEHKIDMQQVWSEFKYLIDNGESFHLTEEEKNLLSKENEIFEAIDPMEELILNRFRWDEPERNLKLTAVDVLQTIGFDLTNHNARYIGKRCGNILTKLTGQKAKRSNGKSWFNLPRLKPESDHFLK